MEREGLYHVTIVLIYLLNQLPKNQKINERFDWNPRESIGYEKVESFTSVSRRWSSLIGGRSETWECGWEDGCCVLSLEARHFLWKAPTRVMSLAWKIRGRKAKESYKWFSEDSLHRDGDRHTLKNWKRQRHESVEGMHRLSVTQRFRVSGLGLWAKIFDLRIN